jgi:hypothetical protein
MQGWMRELDAWAFSCSSLFISLMHSWWIEDGRGEEER